MYLSRCLEWIRNCCNMLHARYTRILSCACD
jgi:hypothetical protein